MARIETYVNDTVISGLDKIIGTDAENNNATKNFTVNDLAAFIADYHGPHSADYIGTVALNGNSLDFNGVGRAFSGSIDLSAYTANDNDFVTNVVLNGVSLDFTGTGGAFAGSVDLTTLAVNDIDYIDNVSLNNYVLEFSGAGRGFTGLIDLRPVAFPYVAGNGIDITNDIISCTVVDTNDIDFTQSVALNGTSLDFTGIGNAFTGSVDLSSLVSSGSTPVALNDLTDVNVGSTPAQSTVLLKGTQEWIAYPLVTYSNFAGDSGSVNANALQSSLNVVGGAGITTSVDAPTQTLTIRNTATGIEKLVQKSDAIGISAGGTADWVMKPLAANTSGGSVHWNANLMSLNNGFVVEIDQFAVDMRLAVSAYATATNPNDNLTMTLYSRNLSTLATSTVASITFDYSKAGTHASTFFDYLYLLAGHEYWIELSSSTGITVNENSTVEWIIQ